MHAFAIAIALVLAPLSAAGAGPSEADFLREMVTPGATEKTPEFNAYYDGAFSIDKLALLASFPFYARQAGTQPRALLVVGPIGPLWTYHVITFVEENNRIRCNALVMPHARITGKSTGLISATELSEFLDQLRASPLLQDRGNTPATISKALPDPDSGDFRFDLLVAQFIDPSPLVRIGNLYLSRSTDRETADQLLETINRRLRGLETTYQHGQTSSAGKHE